MRVCAVVDVSRMGRQRRGVVWYAARTRCGLPFVACPDDLGRGNTVSVVHIRHQELERHGEDAQQCEERRPSAARQELEPQRSLINHARDIRAESHLNRATTGNRVTRRHRYHVCIALGTLPERPARCKGEGRATARGTR